MSSAPASVTKHPATVPPPEAVMPERVPPLVFTSANLRFWGKKSALTLVDQGLTSAAGFGVNVFLARWVPAEIYGAFAVAFAGFLFVSGFQNVLSLEPLSVFGPSRYAGRLERYFMAQLEIHAILASALSAAVILVGLVLWRIVPGSPLIGAVMGGGLALPFMLLLWLVRRMCYVVQRPAIAIIGSAFYLAFIAAGLFVLGHFDQLGSCTAFLLLACGSLLAAGILIWLLGLLKRKPAKETTISWRAVLHENWKYGRWLVGSIVLFSASSQTQTFLVAGYLGLSAAGILRAMLIPSLVMSQVVTATGLLILPTLSYDFGQGLTDRMRHKAVLASISLLCVTICYAVLVEVEATRVGHFLYGEKYANYFWLMPALALIPVVNGIAMGFSMTLRASQKPRFDLVSNLFAAPVAIISAFLFIRMWGLAGAVASMLLSYIVLCGVTLIFFQSSDREPTLSDNSTGIPV